MYICRNIVNFCSDCTESNFNYCNRFDNYCVIARKKCDWVKEFRLGHYDVSKDFNLLGGPRQKKSEPKLKGIFLSKIEEEF